MSEGQLTNDQMDALIAAQIARHEQTQKGLNAEGASIIQKSLIAQGGVIAPAAFGEAAAALQGVDEVIHYIVLLDGSGSMSTHRTAVIDGYNFMLKSLKGDDPLDPMQGSENKASIKMTLWIFRNETAELIYANKPLLACPDLTKNDYVTNGGTPLVKTTLAALSGGSLRSEQLRQGGKNSRTIVCLISDGQNTLWSEVIKGSRVDYNEASVRTLASQLLSTERWTLAMSMAGTEDEAKTYAETIGFPSYMALMGKNGQKPTSKQWRDLFGLYSAAAKSASATGAPGNYGNTFFSSVSTPATNPNP